MDSDTCGRKEDRKRARSSSEAGRYPDVNSLVLRREGGNGLWGLLLGITKELPQGSIPPFLTKHRGVQLQG